jgi:type II secretory pathway component PulJ
MIANHEQLQQTIQQLERMYRALAELRCRVLPGDPQRFQLMAEGPLEEIRDLQKEIDSYLGLSHSEQQFQ